MNSDPIQVILNAFEERGQGKYGSEEVSQLEHALQCATLAIEDGASNQQIVAALLHDLGHIISGDDLPTGLDENLDDMHEERAYQWLLLHFGPDVAEPVRLHVAAKRYLCTVEPLTPRHSHRHRSRASTIKVGRCPTPKWKSFARCHIINWRFNCDDGTTKPRIQILRRSRSMDS